MTARPFGRAGDNLQGSCKSCTPPPAGRITGGQLRRPDLVARLQIGRGVRLRKKERQSEVTELLHVSPIGILFPIIARGIALSLARLASHDDAGARR